MISAYLDIRKTPLLNSLPHPSIINQSRILNILSSAITATSSDQHSPYSKSICPQPPYLSVREDTPIPHPNSHPPRLFFTTLPSTARNQSVPMHFPTHHYNPLQSPPIHSPPTHLIHSPHYTTPHLYITPLHHTASIQDPQPSIHHHASTAALRCEQTPEKGTYQNDPSPFPLSLYMYLALLLFLFLSTPSLNRKN